MNPEPIAGIAHRPDGRPAGVAVYTHGAGGDRDSALLVAVCEQWAQRGWLAIRYNLPFRRRRASGPPPGSAAADQAAVAEAIALAARWAGPGRPVIAGGHSYGGRLTSMAVAADPAVAALSLFSYPLHPPGRPERPRTSHFAEIRVPTVFAHGSADPFGSPAQLWAAARLIGAPTEIVAVEGARHDLRTRAADVARRAVDAALRLSAGG
jgi:uncharacterized protein